MTATALVGGTLIDVRAGTQHPNTTILVDGERIVAVGDGHVPSDANRTDVSGAWLLPGLIDMHAHVTSQDHERSKEKLLHLYVKYGVTTVRDTGGPLVPLQLLRDELAAGKRVGPRLFFAGPILDGRPPVWPAISILVDSTQRARGAVAFLAEQQVNLIKVYNWVPEQSLVAILESAHERGLKVTGHVPRAITMTRAIELGMDCLEHIRITGRELLAPEEAAKIDPLPVARREALLWQHVTLDSEPIERVIRRLADSRVFLDPTMLVDTALCLDEWRVDIDHPANTDVAPEVREAFQRQPKPPIFDLSPDDLTMARDGFYKRQRFVGMCHEAGVRLVAGTDTFGLGKTLPGLGLQNELRLLVEAGLSPLAALQAGTLTAAEALGQSEHLGALEVGKLADVLVLDADPLADIANARKVRMVMKGGQQWEVEGRRSAL